MQPDVRSDRLTLRSDPRRLRDVWREQRLRFLAVLAAAEKPLNGEQVARRAGDDRRYATAAYRLVALRERGYVANVGRDRDGRMLWCITALGRALVTAA